MADGLKGFGWTLTGWAVDPSAGGYRGKMNERQRKFCEHYAADPNATAAAISAGYSPKSAYSCGQRMLKNAEIQNYLRQLQEQAAAGRVADLEEVKMVWTETLRNTSEKTANRLRAGELLARSAGEFIRPGQSGRMSGDDDMGTPSGEQDTPVICLPWNGRQAINAVENDDGEITPFPGAEDDDVLIYLPRSAVEAVFARERQPAKIPEV